MPINLRTGKVSLISLLLLMLIGGGAFWWLRQSDWKQTKSLVKQTTQEVKAKSELPSRVIEIPSGETFGALLQDNGFTAAEAQDIVTASKDVYDLTTIRAGKKIELYTDDAGVVQKLKYSINTEEYLEVTKTRKLETGSSESPVTSTPPDREDTSSRAGERRAPSTQPWSAQKVKVPYEVKIQTTQGTVKDIFYSSALEQGIDELLVLDIADLFQWQVDFALDIRNGDSYKVIYEARYLDGKYVMPGKILAAEFINQGQSYKAFNFTDPDGSDNYYDQDGNSTEKMFLKAPVSFKYISSGFTTGKRYVSAFNVATGHRAIDYAAASGTPIRATADGTVTYAGWTNAGYGNLTSIRHNSTYSTNYGHQSKIIVKVGQKVKQGQTIGYVGSTGFSTGPHLHYEMVKNGVKINPQHEVLPPGKSLGAESKEAFAQVVAEYSQKLEAIK